MPFPLSPIFRFRSCRALAALALAAAWAGAATPPQAVAVTPAPAAGTYSEEVKMVSDASVADSLARQNNLNFSSVRIDGEKTSISLAALTAEQILNAVATKVPTPDLDADAVGGLLQLTSRRAFEQKERTLRGSVTASYDAMAGRVDPDVSVTFGRSLGARQRTGFLLTVQHVREHDRDEEIELEWNADSGQLREFEVRAGDDETVDTNLNGTFDWKLGDKSFAFVRLEAEERAERGGSRSVGYILPAVAGGLPDAGATVHGVTLQRSLDVDEEQARGFLLAAGAGHRGGQWLLDLRLSHRADRREALEERDYNFEEEAVTIVYARAEPAFPTALSLSGGAPGDPARQFLEELELNRGRDRETDSVASFDATRLRRDGPQPGWWKFGGKARLQRTAREQRNNIYEPAGAGLSVGEAGAFSPSEPVLGRRYLHAGFPELAGLRRLFETQPGRFALDEDKTRGDTDPANFDVQQNILAGYAMASFSAGKNRVVAGARLERTASRFAGNEVAFDESGRYESTRALAARSTYTNVFPGVHVSRSLAKSITVFGSWTQSIRRPDYTDLVPARRISRSDREIEEGNADLRPALYTNYDVALDYAYQDDGQVALELFHREIRDPRLTRRTILTDGPFQGYERSRPENGGRARWQGLQLTWQQELAFLRGRLDGLALEVNYTHQRSRQSIESRPGETHALADVPAHEVSVQLTYDRDPYYVSVEFEHTSRTPVSVGRSAREDRFQPPRNGWDVSFSREFRRGLRLFLDVENLTQAPEREYMGDAARPTEYSRQVRGFSLGLKWER